MRVSSQASHDTDSRLILKRDEQTFSTQASSDRNISSKQSRLAHLDRWLGRVVAAPRHNILRALPNLAVLVELADEVRSPHHLHVVQQPLLGQRSARGEQ